ncbi:MAG TPA: hypothetical protein EYN66_04760, partial [Myxococcales bacterium]|nr:hypothetical protein [Myxococcales bacterium]
MLNKLFAESLLTMAILNHKSCCLLLLVALPLAQVLVVGCSSEEESLTEFKVVEEIPSPNDVAQQNNIPLSTPADTSNTNPANDTLSTAPATPAPGQPNLLQAVAQQANLPIPTKDSSVDAIQQFISILIQIPPQGQSQQRQLQFGILVSDELQALAEILLSKEGLTETERRYGYEIKNTAVGRLYR